MYGVDGVVGGRRKPGGSLWIPVAPGYEGDPPFAQESYLTSEILLSWCSKRIINLLQRKPT
jgi:hypothetical protein